MSAEGTQHPMRRILEQELECTGALLQCLDTERSALSKRDLDVLEKTTAAKIQHTETLQKLGKQREQLVTALGFESGAAGLQRCLRSLPATEQLQQLWQQILDNLRACQDGNLTNGGILELGRQHVEQALRILRGQSGAPSLYDPHGGTSADLGQRKLGEV